MKISRRTTIILSLLGAFILLGIVFPPLILDYLVTPLALVLWVIWRVLQSVDQAIYWILLIFSAVAYALLRAYRSAQATADLGYTPASDPNSAMAAFNYWRVAIRVAGDETGKHNTLEHDLGHMLATIYAAKQPRVAQFEIYDALKLRQMPLPENVYTFLFGNEVAGSKRSVKQILHSLWDMPRKRIRRWTGRETADYYQSLEQVLKFMESVLEDSHDGEPVEAHHH